MEIIMKRDRDRDEGLGWESILPALRNIKTFNRIYYKKML